MDVREFGLTATAQRLEKEVRELALDEGRRVGTPGHERARAWLRDRLEAHDLEPYGDAFEHP